ncbi:MAG: isopentenyl-diphosphate Delta-isomerase [Bacteroidota bacterium]
MDEVVLVDIHDKPTGIMEKMEAHLTPNLHRAFSIFLFDKNNNMLLQQRALTKYHSAGLWTNACCSHPRPGETTIMAAKRRLFEELGMHADIHFAFDFIYQVAFENGLHEFEYDHVFTGFYDGNFKLNSSEVAACCYKSIPDIKADLRKNPASYTEWFKIALPKLEAHLAAEKALLNN